MFPTRCLFSRTTYRGAQGSTKQPSPLSRDTAKASALSGQTFKRAQRGLYDGRMIQSGNNVPNSRHKTARVWLPNVQNKRLWSHILDRHVQVRVTTKALRSMDKHGGLDQYLIKTKDEVLGRLGRSLREELRLKLAATQASEGDTGVQALAQLLDRSRVADESSATMARRAEESAALRQ